MIADIVERQLEVAATHQRVTGHQCYLTVGEGWCCEVCDRDFFDPHHKLPNGRCSCGGRGDGRND